MKLKPCPFCGKPPKKNIGIVNCENEWCPIFSMDFSASDWNRRAPPAELVEAWSRFKANKSRMTQPMYDVLNVVKKLCDGGKEDR